MLCGVSLGVGAQTTFNVDMTCAPDGFTDVFVTGPWCGWCANQEYNTMTDPDGDGIYTVTLDESVTGLIEYKYAINGFSGQENLVNDMIYGADCAPITDYAFYAIRLTEQGSTNSDFYGTCDCLCNDSNVAEDQFAVTFQLDLSEYMGSVTSAEIFGTFNGWSVNANPLNDDNSDGIWEATINLEAGLQEFKFRLNGSVDEAFDGSESCTTPPAEYINRIIEVTEDVTLPAVCWNLCSVCNPEPGCTDENACNYNAEATEDDGSCWYDNSCVETNDDSEFLVNTIGVTDYNPEFVDAGYTLLYPNYQPNVYLIDMCGEVIHTWENSSDVRPGNTAYLQENGDLILTYRPQGFANDAIWACGGGAVVERRTWNNEVVWSFTLNDSTGRLHHDIEVKPDGNVFAIAWEHFSAEAALEAGRDPSIVPENGLWSEMILELAPDGNGGANVVWEWHAWDHLVQDLDPTLNNFGAVSENPRKIDINYGSPSNQPSDWLHINAIDFNPFFGHLLLSVPTFDELWIVDYNNFNSGELIWRWGNPQAYGMGTVDDKQLFEQHDCHWVYDHVTFANPDFGKIAVFNNRVPGENDEVYSSAHLLTPSYSDYDNLFATEGGTYLPVDFDWSYVAPDSIESRSHASFQRLENGNSLICYGRWGDVREVTPEGEVAWRYKVPLSNSSGFAFSATQGDELGLDENSIFKILRYPLSFGAFNNVELVTQGPLELEPNPLGSCGGIYSGCTDPMACNYDSLATSDNGSCLTVGDPCDDFDSTTNNDIVNDFCFCEGQEFVEEGCTISIACNYNPYAINDDNSCVFVCPGCTDPDACNFDAGALQEDGTCAYPEDSGWCNCEGAISDALGICGGTCEIDQDADGVCDDVDDCIGILDACGICNGPGAIYPCGCSDFPDGSCSCDGLTFVDQCGVCDGDGTACVGCTYELACNYDPEATIQDVSQCEFGTCGGCLDPLACNYNPTVNGDDGSCEYPAVYLDCAGNCLNDGNGNGVCDENEIFGCAYPSACNFDLQVTADDGSCDYSCVESFCQADYDFGNASWGFSPDLTLGESFAEGIVNLPYADVLHGIFPQGAGEFDPTFPPQLPIDSILFLQAVQPNGMLMDILFTDVATNENFFAQDLGFGLILNNPNSAASPETVIPGEQFCISIFGVPQREGNYEVSFPFQMWSTLGSPFSVSYVIEFPLSVVVATIGCTDPDACNYQPTAVEDDGSCGVLDECGVCAGPGIPEGDCDCDGNVVDAIGVCGGDCSSDFNGNGVCDSDELFGCTYTSALNFDPFATMDDGTCVGFEGTNSGTCLFDGDGDGFVGSGDLLGLLSEFGIDCD